MLNLETIKGRIGIVIDTDLPVDWHFANNLCAFCTGLRGRDPCEFWVKRFFDEMHINPNAQPQIMINLGKEKLHFPNPFTQHSCPVLTDQFVSTPVSPWPNNRYGWNGLYDYVDFHTKANLNGIYIESLELQEYKSANFSVVIFFRQKLHELLFNIIRERASVFCAAYPDSRSGKFHQVSLVKYVEMDVWKFWNDWKNHHENPQEFKKPERKKCPRAIQKIKVDVEQISATL